MLLVADCQILWKNIELMADGALNTVFAAEEFDKIKKA
jgi:predicted Zn-dependent peptidase